MTSSERAAVRELITRHEGYRRTPYHCTAGKLTIGVGRNLDDVGIDQEEARYLLDRDIGRALDDLSSFGWFHVLDTVRQRALIDMRFQLGPAGFRTFGRMIAALARQDYATAATEALDSKWARFDTPARAQTIAAMLRSGDVSGDPLVVAQLGD